MKFSSDAFAEIDEVVGKYRPLLQSLNFRELSKDKVYTPVQKFRNIHLSRCVIVTMGESLPDDTDGYFMFLNDKKRNLFILTIKINDKFFADNILETQSNRKLVGVHEFIHCVAIMLCLSKMADNPNPLLARLEEKIKNKVEMYSQDTFSELLNSVLNDSFKFSSSPTPTDSHFRIGDEDFRGDYADLYANFLFPYSLFIERLGQPLLEYMKSDEKALAIAHVYEELERLVSDKAIVPEIAGSQFANFLQRFVYENPANKIKNSL